MSTQPDRFATGDQPLAGLRRHPAPDANDDTEAHMVQPRREDAAVHDATGVAPEAPSMLGRTYPRASEDDVEGHLSNQTPELAGEEQADQLGSASAEAEESDDEPGPAEETESGQQWW